MLIVPMGWWTRGSGRSGGIGTPFDMGLSSGVVNVDAGTGTISVTTTADCPRGHRIIAIGSTSVRPTAMSLSDGLGTTYSTIEPLSGTGGAGFVMCGKLQSDLPRGSTITLTATTNTSGRWLLDIVGVAGLSDNPADSVGNIATGTSLTPTAVRTSTLSEPSELILGIVTGSRTFFNTITGMTPNGSFINLNGETSGIIFFLAYQVTTTTDPITWSPTVGSTGSGSLQYWTDVIALK